MPFGNSNQPLRKARRAVQVTMASLVAMATLALAGCSTPTGPALAHEKSPAPSPSPTSAATEALSPTPAVPTVTLQCQDPTYPINRSFTIDISSARAPDFTEVWAQPLAHCDAARSADPLTPTEAAAMKAAAASGDTINEIYEICAVVDPDDVYAETDFTPSEDQVTEISAALVLCPAQPHAQAPDRPLPTTLAFVRVCR